MEICILAGGLGTRMGKEKSSLQLGGQTLLQRITRIAQETGCPVRVIRKDIVPRCGPLGGIYTALRSTNQRSVLFLSCDMPFMTVQFLNEMIEKSRGGRSPIFSSKGSIVGFPIIIPKTEEVVVRRQIDEGTFSIKELFQRLRGRKIEPSTGEELLNLNTPEELERAERLLAQREAILSISSLEIRRGKTVLVRDFSWSVQSGEHWVIVGANGSGKTSLLSALLGYLTPTTGDISVLGEAYGNSDWRQLRSRIGLVSSTIRQMMPENEPAWITVASGRYAMIDFWGTPNREDKREAIRMLRMTECEYLADRDWTYLSQGERQRVLIGRALMSKPAILILDEPCAGLDPAAREHFLDFLDGLGRQPNAPALVLVTHHVEEIMPVFTHALILKRGVKMGEGRLGQTLTSKALSEAFECPMELRKRGGRYSLKVGKKDDVVV